MANKWPLTQQELLTKYPQYTIPDNLVQDAPFFFANAIDKINILTANQISTIFDSLDPTQQESNYRALGELFYFYLNAGANFLRGSLSNSQGSISISQNFDFPEDIPIKIYQLLELGGVYKQNPSQAISNNNLSFAGGNNNIYSDITKSGYLTKYLADHTYIQKGGITSKNNSVNITYTPDGNLGKPAFDLQATGVKDPQVETNKENIATNASNIATNTTNIATNKNNIETNKQNIASNLSQININTTKITENANALPTKLEIDDIVAGKNIYLHKNPSTRKIVIDANLPVGGGGGSGIEPKDLDPKSIEKIQATGEKSATYKAISLYTITPISGNNYITPEIISNSIKGLDQDIETNKQNITNNETNIAKNTANILANTNNIATNKTDIATNKTNISTNTTNIATNKNDITTNTTNISTNTKNILKNKNGVATNTTNILTNKENITTNTTNINKKQDKLIPLNSSTDQKSNIGFENNNQSIFVKTEENLNYPQPTIRTGGNNANEQHIYVPFDKDTIYYDATNKVWKAKGGSGGSGSWKQVFQAEGSPTSKEIDLYGYYFYGGTPFSFDIKNGDRIVFSILNDQVSASYEEYNSFTYFDLPNYATSNNAESISQIFKPQQEGQLDKLGGIEVDKIVYSYIKSPSGLNLYLQPLNPSTKFDTTKLGGKIKVRIYRYE